MLTPEFYDSIRFIFAAGKFLKNSLQDAPTLHKNETIAVVANGYAHSRELLKLIHLRVRQDVPMSRRIDSLTIAGIQRYEVLPIIC